MLRQGEEVVEPYLASCLATDMLVGQLVAEETVARLAFVVDEVNIVVA